MSNEKTWRRLAFLISRFEKSIKVPFTNLRLVDRDDLQELMNIATLYGDIPEINRTGIARKILILNSHAREEK